VFERVLKKQAPAVVIQSEMSHHVSFDEIQEVLLRSAEDTISTHALAGNVARSVPTHTTDEEWVVATVGFVADDQDGRVTLLGPRRVVRRLQPPPESWHQSICEATERDALGELANMLIGRFKHHLLTRGAMITITTPSTGISRTMRPHASGGPFPSCLFVPIGNDRLYLHLQTSADGEEKPLPSTRRPVVLPEVMEGDLVLF